MQEQKVLAQLANVLAQAVKVLTQEVKAAVTPAMPVY